MLRVAYRAFLATAVALIAVFQLRPYIAYSPEQLTAVGLVIDDAFFYSTIAENFQQLSLLTFDGVMTTTGVQPLLMVIQIGLVELLPQVDGLTLLMWVSVVSYLLFAFLTVWYVARGTRSAMLAATAVAAMLLLNAGFQRLVIKGLETPLMLLAVIVTLNAVDFAMQHRRTPPEQFNAWLALPLAITAVLCFFARTDLFAVVIVIGIWTALAGQRRPDIRASLLYCAVAAAAIIPYLTFNWLTQGSIMPISGAVKLHYMHSFYPTLSDYWRSNEWVGYMAAFARVLPLPDNLSYALAYPALLLAAYGVWRKRRALLFPTSIRLLTLVILVHIFTMQLVYREIRSYTAYYFAIELLWLVLVAGLFVAQRVSTFNGSSVRRAAALTTAAGAAILLLFQWQMVPVEPQEYWVQRLKLAQDIRQLVPESQPVGAFWPGALAHFSDRAIVPLDGVAGSREYFEAYVVPQRELVYLEDNQIRYLAIYLNEPVSDLLLSHTPPAVDEWSMLGERRLWELRDTPMKVLSLRTIAGTDGGWYLLELDYDGRVPASLVE